MEAQRGSVALRGLTVDDGEGDKVLRRWIDGDPVDGDLARQNGHHPEPDEPAHEDAGRTAGWVSAGGVLHWEPGEAEESAAAQAHSPLAAEAFEVPEGAPDAPRVAAVRAWLLRKGELASEDLGALLLRQREQRHDEAPSGRRPRRGPPAPSEVDLGLAEQQAAFDEYVLLAETLDETVAHASLARALVEFYLWLAEHLDGLVAASRTLRADATPDPLTVAAWNGHAQAVVATRGRVERMMAPASDD